MDKWIKILCFVLLMLVVFWFVLFVCARVHAAPIPFDRNILKVENAILHIVKIGIPKHKIKPFPNHPITKDLEGRRELSTGIVVASRRKAVPQMLLVSMAFREGSFRNDAVGKIGEVSTFQMVQGVIKHLNCDVSTFAGAAECAAIWLAMKSAQCQSLEGGFLRYATGRRICRPDSEHLKWLVWDRFGIARRLERLVPEEERPKLTERRPRRRLPGVLSSTRTLGRGDRGGAHNRF